MPRFYCPAPLQTGDMLELPAGAARHVQVLRLQPGDSITLFNHGPGWAVGNGTSPGGEFAATVTQMGRSHVQVQVGAHHAVEREPTRLVHLALAMPANERMDWLVEKATELGVASIQPLMSERSVLRLSGERADKKTAHWQSVAVSACEQCGGNRVPLVQPVATLAHWLRALPEGGTAATGQSAAARLLLTLRDGSRPLREASQADAEQEMVFLSGPEGGLSAAEEDVALACGFIAVSLGARVLRAETAALTALARLV
ncbi:MAG: 16S rRNA (uracil(1498)-N(3))-methyltransferase [Betaproteobacteria bacterium]